MNTAAVPVGEIAALSSAALWATASVLWTRQMAVSRPVAMNLFKTALCLPLFALVLVFFGGGGSADRIGLAALALLFISGVIGMSIGDTLYFAALARIGARRTMMIQTLSPVFAGLLSLFLAQNLPGPRASFGVALVLSGLLLVLRERPLGIVIPGRVRSGLTLALGSAFCQALGIVLTKEGIKEVGVLEASTIRIIGGVLGILLVESLRGQLRRTVRDALRPPALSRVIPATLMGTFFGFFLFQVAVAYADPATAAALTGTSPLFVAPLSVVFLGELMGGGGWFGTVLAVVGIALIMTA